MAKPDEKENRQIHVIPPPKEWDGTYPFRPKSRAELFRAIDRINRRKKTENTTRHHRRAGDVHVVRNTEDISKCGES
jgi:hypothetical protein